MERLPEHCIAKIISFTTPLDCCRLSAASPLWKSAADSDYVWVRFLPPCFPDILVRAVKKVEYSSLKELFFQFCDSILIDKGRMLFSLKRSNGKVSISLSPRDLFFFNLEEFDSFLQIFHTADVSPEMWTELELGEAPPAAFRFKRIALLVLSDGLGMVGEIHPWMLSEKTYYSARVIFRCSGNSLGLEYPLLAASQEGGIYCFKRVSFNPWNVFSLPPMCVDPYGGIELADLRGDGWMELEVGRFFCEGIYEREALVSFSLIDVRRRTRSGLIVEGIEVCPLN